MARLSAAIALALSLALVAAAPADGSAAWVWPLRGEVITPYRNGDDPYASGQHRGIDVAGRIGAPVVAARAGIVRFAGTAGYSGLTVGVRTADGGYDTSYLHLSAISVRKGEQVAAGQRLGAVGQTGRPASPRPHLHFGVRDAGSRHGYHDPLDFLRPPARPRPEPRRPPIRVGAPARPSPVPLANPGPDAAPRSVPPRVPLRLPRPVPALRPVPGGHGVPVDAPLGAPARRGAPARVPEAGPAGAPAAEPAPAPGSARAPRLPAPHRAPGTAPAGHGPDLGWALACLGLLLAAALMGTKGGRPDGRGPRRRAPDRVAALLRPLVGRG